MKGGNFLDTNIIVYSLGNNQVIENKLKILNPYIWNDMMIDIQNTMKIYKF